MTPFLAGFRDELTKTAFGPKAVSSVLRAAKRRQIPKAMAKRMAKARGGPYIAAIQRGKHQAILSPPGWEQAAAKSHRAFDTPGKHRKMRSALVKGHELDEMAAMRKLPRQATAQGHANWDVLLREHNRLVRMPKKHAPLGESIKKLRRSETAPMRRAGVAFGEGRRFSRHARKRLSNIIERKELERTQFSRPPQWVHSSLASGKGVR